MAERAAAVDATLTDAAAAAALLARVGAPLPTATEVAVTTALAKLRGLAKMAAARREELAPRRAAEAVRLTAAAADLGARLRAFLARVADAKLGEAPATQVQPHHAAAALSAVEGLLHGGGKHDDTSTRCLADLEAAAAELRAKQAMMDVFEFDVAPLVAVKVRVDGGGEGGESARTLQTKPATLSSPRSVRPGRHQGHVDHSLHRSRLPGRVGCHPMGHRRHRRHLRLRARSGQSARGRAARRARARRAQGSGRQAE